ncbi:MAG: T9SS type A sorting domain-containing protein, partial [Bacteroidota bacterium]
EHELPVCEINCGDLSICTGESTELCAAAGFASYSWSNGATTRCITVSAGGTYYVTVTNAYGCSSTCNTTVVEYQLPVCSINGGYACCQGDPMQICVPASVGAVSYLWSTGATTRCIETYTTGTYTVTVTNQNGCTSTCDKYVLFYPRPEITMPVFGQVCDTLTSGITLSGATPVGGVYSGDGVVNGVFYPAVAGLGTHYIYYKSDNGHCSSIDSALIEVVTCVCLVPSTPQITGLASVCRSSQSSYVAVGATGATGYEWTVTGGATIIYGQGTDSIVVQFGCMTCTGGNVCVTASNRCGAAPQVCVPFGIVLTAPVLAGTINGPLTEVCPGSAIQYCITPVPNATNYVWTIPANTSIIAGNGTSCITLQILPGFASGNLIVQGQNCKGLSGSKTISLKSLPGQPAAIAGLTSPLCNVTNVAFSIAPVSGATGYNWIVPAGATITSGVNTTSITVDFGPAFVSGNVSVNATNACGAGPQRHLAVKAKPNTPASINGPLSVCVNDAGVAYSVVAETGVTYAWVVPTGASVVSGQGTASVLVNFGAASGNVKVTPSNVCGSAAAKLIAVNVTSCARLTYGNSTEVSGDIKVYPNPAKSDLTVQFNSQEEKQYTITITDIIGKVVYNTVFNSVEGDNQAKLNVSDFPQGLYMLTLKGEGFNKVVRITVQ